ncbi:CYTH domain-containing protein [Bosea caraganae]|uniref:CYTH domain-containing protein n=2 Tax=Bosea caraganae TaxID=2763117 RepID=A0A370LD22_9HYPH|nr:CYTH domain-containing protein [Bosea caraganae]RDJ29874.1 CYTH domain-containing protein [Bosea caraganae]
MGIEIERKFLVVGDGWQKAARPGCSMRQGYLAQSGSTSIVRVRCAEDRAFLTVKGQREGLVRPEFEYEIPYTEAEEMLRTLCRNPPIEKTRYRVKLGELSWDVDVFSGRLDGLVLAEVELKCVDQPVELPAWIGAEVTYDPQYGNAVLSEIPVMPSAPAPQRTST